MFLSIILNFNSLLLGNFLGEYMYIKDLKNHYFEDDSFYSILDSFNLLGKIELIKQSYKNGCIEDVLKGIDVYSGCNNLGWDTRSAVIGNLKDLPQDEVLELVMNAGSTNDLVDIINELYLKEALKDIGKFLYTHAKFGDEIK